MMISSALGVVFPRFWQILFANALVFSIGYLASSPVASNNQTTAFFFSLVVVAAFAIKKDFRDRDDVFLVIASAGRWLLPVMYFYGIYHKINLDFLNPDVSCAVVLYRALFDGTWFAGWHIGHWTAIYATFIVEGIAMIALFVPRLKKYGMFVGIPFHIVIGFTGYAYYKDFSTIVLVLYAMFIPREAYSAAFRTFSERFGTGRVLSAGRLALLGFACGYLLFSGMLTEPANAIPSDLAFMPFFAIFSLAFFAFAVRFTPRDGGAAPACAPKWMYVLPILFFVNGLSPYLGLKTESSIAMFSNLHTEGGQTNHLLHGVVPGGWSYQSALVQPVSSNSSYFNASVIDNGLWLTRYELDRKLATIPGLVIEVASPQGPVSTAGDWENTYLQSNWFARRFLVFKPVDFSNPKPCTH